MKINPAHIQSYQNMSLPSRIGETGRTRQIGNENRQVGKTDKTNGIDGANFSSYLSKAEKKYLVEKFFDAGEASRSDSTTADRTRGTLLDIKA